MRSRCCNARLTALASGSAYRSPSRIGEHERGAREQVDDVVLAEVDEREAEGPRVGPAGDPLANPHLGEQHRRHQRGREVERRHRGPGVAAEHVVEHRPGLPPLLLSDLDHDPADLGVGVPLLGGPPRRRGRDRGVDDAAEVIDGRHLPRGPRELLLVAGEDVGEGPVGLEEPGPVDPAEEAVDDVPVAEPAERPLQPDVGQLSAAEDPVDADRVADAQPALGPLGVVVGELVPQHERPHLQRVHPGVAQLGPGSQDGQRRGTGRQGRRRHRRRDPALLAHQRNGESRRQGRRSGALHQRAPGRGSSRCAAVAGQGGASLKRHACALPIIHV